MLHRGNTVICGLNTEICSAVWKAGEHSSQTMLYMQSRARSGRSEPGSLRGGKEVPSQAGKRVGKMHCGEWVSWSQSVGE